MTTMTGFKPPTDGELRKEALDFLKGQPARYRRLTAAGELEEVIADKVAEAKRYAAVLMESGTFESQAWYWAVRVKILEREPD